MVRLRPKVGETYTYAGGRSGRKVLLAVVECNPPGFRCKFFALSLANI